MIRLALIGAVVAALAVAVIELRASRAELAEVKRQLAGERATTVFRMGEAARQIEAAALDMELQQGAGADAPLSDYLLGGAGRVWP